MFLGENISKIKCAFVKVTFVWRRLIFSHYAINRCKYVIGNKDVSKNFSQQKSRQSRRQLVNFYRDILFHLYYSHAWLSRHLAMSTYFLSPLILGFSLGISPSVISTPRYFDINFPVQRRKFRHFKFCRWAVDDFLPTVCKLFFVCFQICVW